MTATTQRAHAGSGDLGTMQGLVQSMWSLQSRFHIGDLAWQLATGSEERLIALWQSGAETVAWGWLHLPAYLYLVVHHDRSELASDVLSWFEDNASGERLGVDVLDKEAHLIDALVARGYRQRDRGPFDLYTTLDLAELPAKPLLPTGLRFCSMADANDLERRVASHRAAWHPSSMTVERYRRVVASRPYRAELDWMIEISDGRFVANTCLWYDEVNEVALLEPLGVDPGFRRQGFARAVISEGAACGARAGSQARRCLSARR